MLCDIQRSIKECKTSRSINMILVNKVVTFRQMKINIIDWFYRIFAVSSLWIHIQHTVTSLLTRQHPLKYTIYWIEFNGICSSNFFFSRCFQSTHVHTTQKPLRYGWLKWQLPCLFSLIFLFLFLALSLRFWPTSVVFMCRRRCWV